MQTQVETINNFFQRTDLTAIESKLKQRCQNLKAQLDQVTAEVQTKRSELLQKEEEARGITFQMEGFLQFVLDVEIDRANQSA